MVRSERSVFTVTGDDHLKLIIPLVAFVQKHPLYFNLFIILSLFISRLILSLSLILSLHLWFLVLSL